MKKVYELCKGRHETPAKEFIFEVIEDPTDLQKMHDIAEEKLAGAEELVLYVTGLTMALVEVIKVCQENNIDLTLMHYDRNTGEYFEQEV